MDKTAFNIQMSYTVSDAEKQQANKALIYFKAAENTLLQASDHLNIMLTPFKDNSDIKPEDIEKVRAVIRRFRDKAIENFDEFKSLAFKCVNIMQIFSNDTQTLKLMKSFISSIDELEVKVNAFAKLFNDLQSKDFTAEVVKSIEAIQEQCSEIEEIIDDRIKGHIQSNILATSWVDSVGNNLDMKIEKKTPLIMDLFNSRQEQLNDEIKERGMKGIQ